MSDLSDAQLAMLRKQLERWRDNPTVIGAAGLGVNFGVVMDEVEALRADLAKTQAELEPLSLRVEEAYRERDKHIDAASAARLECAKAQARCAELEKIVTQLQKKLLRKASEEILSRERHPLYTTWCKMRERCFRKAALDYPRYGGRGIKVCDRWLGKEGFINFVSDMGAKPTPRHSLDRINNDGHYEPSNCRWATHKEQEANRSWPRALLGRQISDFEGLVLCAAADEWTHLSIPKLGRRFGVGRSTAGSARRRQRRFSGVPKPVPMTPEIRKALAEAFGSGE